MSRAEVLQDDSRSVTVAVRNDVVQITVAENPSTGYRWILSPVSQRLFAVEESSVQAPETPMPGAPGRRRLVLRLRGGARSGVVELQLVRPWQPDQPVQSIAVSVEF